MDSAVPVLFEMRTLTLDRGDIGKRLDLVVRRHLTDITAATRTRIQRWIERGSVAVNGTPVRFEKSINVNIGVRQTR